MVKDSKFHYGTLKRALLSSEYGSFCKSINLLKIKSKSKKKYNQSFGRLKNSDDEKTEIRGIQKRKKKK